MAHTLPLLEREHELLKRQASEVLEFKDPEFQRFIDDLIHSTGAHEGVGIAAPQVGRSVRLFILAPKSNSRYPDAVEMPPLAVINPRILRLHGPIEKDWEGCLSVPGFRGLVPRYREVDVAFHDRTGGGRTLTLSGFPARIFQHEYDHLEGILYPERMESEDKLLTLEEFGALKGTTPSN